MFRAFFCFGWIAFWKRKIKMAYRYECPANDWFCPYFENGECRLRNAPQECDAFFGIEDDGRYALD